MLLTGCISTTEVVYKPYVPDLDFPIFPDLEGEERNANNTVTVPGEWIIRMQEFHIYYDELEKDYEGIKKLKVCGFAYAISLGVMDFNISKDNWSEKKVEKKEEACEVEK